MSAYGDFLGAFSELFADFKVYAFTPKTGGGYTSSYVKTVRAIKQTAGDSLNVAGMHDNYRGQGTLHKLSDYVLFSYAPLDIGDNVVQINGDWYRPMSQELWDDEGGFYRLEVSKMVGTVLQEPSNAPIAGSFE